MSIIYMLCLSLNNIVGRFAYMKLYYFSFFLRQRETAVELRSLGVLLNGIYATLSLWLV